VKTCLLAGMVMLACASRLALADPCSVTIEATDQMQYNTHELSVPASCSDIEVTFKNSGSLPSKIMGHDWVLAKATDVSGIVNAALAAGRAQGFLPANDKRIIAATPLVGGGESVSVRFSANLLEKGARYAYFCTVPGHSSLMRGTFAFGDGRDATRPPG
jgi:azurin